MKTVFLLIAAIALSACADDGPLERALYAPARTPDGLAAMQACEDKAAALWAGATTPSGIGGSEDSPFFQWSEDFHGCMIRKGYVDG